ncbi:MAG: glutamate--tRNA ligase [Pontiellaceae bacterium]
MSVRTRFAPSPTGKVHIGNIRVAIFNWLFARHHNGSFLLRVEDTDRERSTEESIATLLDTLEWLDLTFDEDALYQSNRKKEHLASADLLLSKGLAYKEDKGNKGKGECIIFKMPNENIYFNDSIKGRLHKSAEDMKDFVIVRSDGTPVFHLANVVDDIHQKISHVIRGDDHIENTFRHIALYRALNEDIPNFSHLPMIINAQGKPYSKRDGDAFVHDFKDKSFSSEALFNYLTLLGWSAGNDQEIFRKEEIIKLFSLERCLSSAAQFDIKKLTWMNGEYILNMSSEKFHEKVYPIISNSYPTASKENIKDVISLIKERVKIFSEIPNMVKFFFDDNYDFNTKAVDKKLKKDGVKQILLDLIILFKNLDAFTSSTIQEELNTYVSSSTSKFGEVMIPLRLSLSGQSGGPDLFNIIAILGKDKVIKRIQKTIDKFLI